MPLLRYAVGDEAENPDRPAHADVDCRCCAKSSDAPVDYLLSPSGERRRVNFRYALAAIAAIREYQVAQVGLDEIEVRLVTAATHRCRAGAGGGPHGRRVGGEFRIELAFPASIARTEAGKLRTLSRN